jgi:UDP-glucose 4-epimerase
MDNRSRSNIGSPLDSQSHSPTNVDTPATETSSLFDETNLTALLRSHPFHEQYILVTGGLGFIGSHTTLELLKADYNVIIIDNMTNSYTHVFDRILTLASAYHEKRGSSMPSLKLHEHDYRDLGSLRDLLKEYELPLHWGSPKSKVAGVIHFAAHKAVEESIRNPLKYYSNNVTGLVDFVSTLGDFGIKTFIFSSSATVYGTLANSGVPLREELCTHKQEILQTHDGTNYAVEAGSTGITNPYGRTKWMCEAILADVAASDPEWTIVALRYFNPIGCDSSGLLGEDPKGKPTNLLPVVVNVMTGRSPELQMFGTDWETDDGTAVRDFIHVTDLACGHIAALDTANSGRLQENFRAFNLGTGRGYSVMEVVTAMESVSSQPIAKKAVGRRPGDVGYCVAAASRSQQELKWKTEKTLTDACVDICNFLKSESNLER